MYLIYIIALGQAAGCDQLDSFRCSKLSTNVELQELKSGWGWANARLETILVIYDGK